MKYRKHAAALLAATAMLTSACGGGDGGSTSGSTGGGQPAPNSPAAPKADQNKVATGTEKVPAPQDVKVVACDNNPAQYYSTTVKLEVRNATDQPQRYAVGVVLKNAAGQEVGNALFAKNRMEPGQVVTESVPGSGIQLPNPVTCEVTRADRLAPK